MKRAGWQLRGYLALSRLIPVVGPRVLQRRVMRGKEDPDRWREKLGQATRQRPDGRLIWLHAVGLGEVQALRGLIAEMARQYEDLSFLVTSSARSSAQVFAANPPPRTIHQMLPLDAPRYLLRFLEHWRPDLSIWAEQDIWPGAVVAASKAGVPLALVNARMNAKSFARRRRVRGLYEDVLGLFALISAQDPNTAQHLKLLGAQEVRQDVPLKFAAPPLLYNAQELAALKLACEGRKIWLVASSHAADEAVALAAFEQMSNVLIIIAPRDVTRRDQIKRAAQLSGLKANIRSYSEEISKCDVYIADTFGEMGLWYRLATVALIGGSFDDTEGHNPWEAAGLNCAVLYGPRVANFTVDYTALMAADAAMQVQTDTLANAFAGDHTDMAARGRALVQAGRDGLAPLARDVLALMRGNRHGG